MKTGGGGGNGTFFFGVNSLVAIAVGLVRFALHVVWKGEVAVFVEIGRGVPLDESFSFLVGLHHCSGALANLDGAAVPHLSTGANEAPPVVGIGGVGADELDLAIVREESGGDDFGVVEDEKVIGREEVVEVAEAMVGNLAGGPVDEHHA